MATSPITPYKNNTQTQSFTLARSDATTTTWLAADRPIACPYKVEEVRRIAGSTSPANDQIVLRVSRVEPNASSGKLATFVAEVRLSIPKDQTVLQTSVMKEAIAIAVSLVNESAAVAATTVNAGKLLSGIDL